MIEERSAWGLEIEANARYQYHRHGYVLAGLGVEGLLRSRNLWTTGEANPEGTHDGRGMLFLSLASGGGMFQTRWVVGLTEPELRLEFGIVTGRY